VALLRISIFCKFPGKNAELDKCDIIHVSPTAEQLLITRARTFEKGALAEIFDRYYFGIYSYALRLLGDSDLARECMSATEIPLAASLVTDPEHDPAQAVARRMELQKIRSAMARLTPEQRQVLSLKYLENWENEQIAQAMNKPVGAVKSLQHRAINTLRRLIK